MAKSIKITFQDPFIKAGIESSDCDTAGISSGTGRSKKNEIQRHIERLKGTMGVYIWGLRLNIEGKCHFVPCYAGEGILRIRLNDHYKVRTGVDSNQGLYDFSQSQYIISDIQARYHSMGIYDSIVNKAGYKSRINHAAHIPHLIYWQDPNFFYDRCQQKGPVSVREKVNHLEAIILLNQIHTLHSSNEALRLRQLIEKTKTNFDHSFYFIYAEKVDGMKTTEMEHATKNALKTIGLFTTSNAAGGYPAATIHLPSGTPMAHDLWTPAGTRTISVPARPEVPSVPKISTPRTH